MFDTSDIIKFPICVKLIVFSNFTVTSVSGFSALGSIAVLVALMTMVAEVRTVREGMSERERAYKSMMISSSETQVNKSIRVVNPKKEQAQITALGY
jgi:hypothetical protein